MQEVLIVDIQYLTMEVRTKYGSEEEIIKYLREKTGYNSILLIDGSKHNQVSGTIPLPPVYKI